MNKTIKISEVSALNKCSISEKDLPGKIFYLDTGSITRNKITEFQDLDVSKDKVPSRAKRKVNNNTIIYSTVRPNQEHFGFMTDPPSNLIVSTGFTTIDVNSKDILPKFLYYLLSQNYVTSHLQKIAENSVSSYPSINASDIGALEFDVPESTTEQQKIVDTLTSLDKKIEVNNKISYELEAMAKTLYDYWFVQFDFPDKNGRPYKSSGGKMVYNKVLKREIPEGWKSKKLEDIANITMGQSPAGSSYNEDGVGTVFFQGSTDFGDLFPTIRQYTTEPNRMAKAGDILLSVRAPVGTMNIANIDCCIGRGLAALNSKTESDGFLFYVMQYFKQIFDYRNSEGTTFGSITKNDLHSLPLAYPGDELVAKYNQTVASSNQMIFKNNLENIELERLRDWLLPMLMNGQVTVS